MPRSLLSGLVLLVSRVWPATTHAPFHLQQAGGGSPAGCRVVTDRRSRQQPSVVDHQPGGNRGR
jgi:hypothetical protein